MRQRVTAILVARNGADYLERTLSALAAQSRRPDIYIAVDAGSSDASAAMLAASGPTQLVSVPPRVSPSFGAALGFAIQGLPAAESQKSESRDGAAPEEPDEWLWLLAHDSAPEPRALQQLLAAVEIAPSVAIAGPKIMRWDAPDVIAEFGESVTRFGASMPLVEGELDQAQHDVSSDVLAVGANGMLVRRSLWQRLGGFDPALPSVDASLDFSIRARLAGFRVVLVPGARVSAAGGAEHFGRKSVSAAREARVARSAQLHRRLVYAPAAAVPLHWLSLVPLAILRALGHLLGKHPGFVWGEFSAAFGAAFDGSVPAARRNLKRARVLGWAAIAPLRLPWAEVRERRGQSRDAHAAASAPSNEEPRIGYLGGGGLWVALLAGLIGVISFGPFLGAQALSGGGLLPLSTTVGELWSNVGYGWREIGTGFVGAADPFAAVLAVLGSLTFWAPSFSIVLLYLLALPLASAGAWFAARRMTRNRWIPLVAALLWAVAPPLLSSLTTGHLGAVIAHIALPWLVLATLNASRSWPAAAGAGLLFAVVTASAPILAPALLALWLAWVIAQPRGILRLLSIPVLSVMLFVPLVVQQLMRGNPLALLADPGVPSAALAPSGGQLALLSPAPGLGGWSALVEALALPAGSAHIVVAALLAPVGVLALLALFVPGSRRSIPALVLALLGFATAMLAAHIEVTAVGARTVAVWPGAALSLFWLGLLGGVIVALGALRRASVAVGMLAVVTTIVLVIPLLGSVLMGTAEVRVSSGRILPAVVDAEARTTPRIATVTLVPEGADELGAVLQRGRGTTLDAQSTLAATATELSESQETLARLAGNLVSRGGYEPEADLSELFVGFVVLADVHPGVADSEGARAVHERAAESLDSNPRLTAVGQTSAGLLWRVQTLPEDTLAVPLGNTDTLQGRVLLIAQGLIFFFTILLAIPTQRRRRRVRAPSLGEGPAATFEVDTDD